MRKFHLVYPLFILLAFAQCKKSKDEASKVPESIQEYLDVEETTVVDLNIPFPDSPYTLVELISGVRCPTVPNAVAALDTLIQKPGYAIIPVVLHMGGQNFVQSFPFPKDQDLNMPKVFADDYFQLLQKPNGIPYFLVNRSSGNNMISKIDSLVQANKLTTSWMNIGMKIHDYNTLSRVMSYSLQFHLQEELKADLHFTAYIVEDSIIGRQEHTMGEYNNYVHNHVLRACPNWNVSLTNGSTALVKGTKITRKFQFEIPKELETKNCHIILFTHDNNKVYQATRLSLMP